MASQQFFSLVDCVMVVSLLLSFLYLHVGPFFSVSGVQLFSPLLLVLKEGLFSDQLSECCLCSFHPRVSKRLQKVVWVDTVHICLLSLNGVICLPACKFFCPLTLAARRRIRLPISSRNFVMEILGLKLSPGQPCLRLLRLRG